jgi:peptidoglycan/LPS O-acetylase OafA/YrhL
VTVDLSPSVTPSRDRTLDGLRGLAVLAVVYVHYSFYSGLMPVPGSGYLGVAVFFVLSGYLITRIVWRNGKGLGIHGYRAFVRRRVQRLYPAMLGLVLVGTPAMAVAGPETLSQDVRAGVTAFFQLTAFAEVIGDPVLEPWIPTWSLSVEWTFYLAWPLMLAVMAKRGLPALAASRVTWGMAAVLYAVALPLGASAFYILPIANIGVMMVGGGLALLHLHRKELGVEHERGRDPQIAALALLLFLVLVLVPGPGSAHAAYRWLLLPSAVLAACMLIDQRPGTRGPTRFLLESWPLRNLGLMSYSVYLWHVPVLWTVWFALPDQAAGTRAAIALLVLVPVVGVSFTLLEKPWLRVPAAARGTRVPEAAVSVVPVTPQLEAP